jgi:hypothetical protein
VADFASPVPPGDYLAGLSVRDARGRRGVVRQSVHVNPPRPTVELSDIVLSCGAPLMSPPGTPPAIRLTPNAEARVGPSQPLTVYFETYHLRPDHDGLTRFEFEYTVRSLDRDSRFWIQRLLSPRAEIPAVSATRREEQAGTLRRQSVSIPVQNLPDGRYRLEIRVRDLVSNGEARGAVDFAKGPVATPGDVES